MNQFDSCSYDELTGCIKARIEWIREINTFRKDTNCEQYSHIRSCLSFKKLGYKNEIKRLLKMRRVLKKSYLNNWDSNILSTK